MFTISAISESLTTSHFLSFINVKYTETTKSTNDKRNNARMIISFFLESSTDFATANLITGETWLLLLYDFSSFLGLPGHDFGAVFGFLEINSFFGLPGLFFLFIDILAYLRNKWIQDVRYKNALVHMSYIYYLFC